MDVPKDVQNALYEYTAQKPVEKDPVPAVNDSEIEKAIEMILAAEKPYIYIGGGAIVHASNERDGIKISSNAAYTTILAVRRVV